MHNNYYYIRQVSAALGQILIGRAVDSAFTQDRDELVVGFLSQTDIIFVRAILKNDFVCLTFPTDFHRARKNTVELFQELNGKTVIGVIQYQNDRSFALQFESDLLLLFKLHGNRANILLYKENEVIELFQNNIEADAQLQPESLHRQLAPTFEDFLKANRNPSKVYPTLGKLAISYLNSQGFSEHQPDVQWRILQEFIHQLEHPDKYYVCKLQNPVTEIEEVVLSLFPIGTVEAEYGNPLEAGNRFYGLYARESTFEREKNLALQKLEKRRKQTESYLLKTYEKLEPLQAEGRNEQLANILMANLHQIPASSETIELFDFYHDRPVQIKLKKDLSAQKNAETYYRKAKNEKIEIGILKKSIEQKEKELNLILHQTAQIVSLKSLKSLRNYLKEQNLEIETQAPQLQDLFRRYEYMGFEILVGKNAQNNDLLIRDYAWKEDLWLHAKDVTGSHVVIKYQSGKKFPEPVIEKAAQLAAYYSKRKTDTLCPVTVTPRKFIRKPKGLPPGAVIVDKEKVVLVEPSSF